MKYLKISPFSLPFLTVIALHRVKKSPLIIGIVDRIKINSEQLFPFSESELSHRFVYFAAIAQVWINLHRQNVFYTVMLWKGSQVPQEEDEEAVTKKAIKELEIFVSQIFYNFFLFISFFQLLCFITLLYFFYPRHLPTPTPTTHTHDLYPLPTTFSYTLFKSLETFLNRINFPTEMQSKVTWDLT